MGDFNELVEKLSAEDGEKQQCCAPTSDELGQARVREALTEEEAKLKALMAAQNALSAMKYAEPRKEAHVRKVKNGFLVFGGYSPHPYGLPTMKEPEETYCATLFQVNEEIERLLS